MKSHRIPPFTCPVCGYVMDATTSLRQQNAPKPGSLTLCARCGEIFVFDERLRPRQPDPMELLRYQLAPVWTLVCDAQRHIRARRKQERGGTP